MKNFILTFIVCMFSMVANAQVIKLADTDTVYIKNQFGTQLYHASADCYKLSTSGGDIKELTLKKARHGYFPCKHCLPTKEVKMEDNCIHCHPELAEQINNNTTGKSLAVNTITDQHLYNAGKYMKKSATMNYIAIGCTVAGGAIASIPAFNTEMKDSDRTTCFVVGGLFGAAAIVSELMSIHYRFKNGVELQMSGCSATVKF